MTGRRLKLTLILGVLLASGLALLAWTQVWINADVAMLGAVQRHLPVPGSTASPALSALALAGLALGGARTIAGPVIRVVLGLLEVLLGVSVFLAAFAAVSDPAAASAGAVTKATGIAGKNSIDDPDLDRFLPRDAGGLGDRSGAGPARRPGTRR